jgi:formyltetrahydrofolate hydrolase
MTLGVVLMSHGSQGSVLLTRQVDQPGIVAGVSSLLAKDSVNISFMTVGRTGGLDWAE